VESTSYINDPTLFFLIVPQRIAKKSQAMHQSEKEMNVTAKDFIKNIKLVTTDNENIKIHQTNKKIHKREKRNV
jgi:hypothetical protein